MGNQPLDELTEFDKKLRRRIIEAGGRGLGRIEQYYWAKATENYPDADLLTGTRQELGSYLAQSRQRLKQHGLIQELIPGIAVAIEALAAQESISLATAERTAKATLAATKPASAPTAPVDPRLVNLWTALLTTAGCKGLRSSEAITIAWQSGQRYGFNKGDLSRLQFSSGMLTALSFLKESGQILVDEDGLVALSDSDSAEEAVNNPPISQPKSAVRARTKARSSSQKPRREVEETELVQDVIASEENQPALVQPDTGIVSIQRRRSSLLLDYLRICGQKTREEIVQWATSNPDLELTEVRPKSVSREITRCCWTLTNVGLAEWADDDGKKKLFPIGENGSISHEASILSDPWQQTVYSIIKFNDLRFDTVGIVDFVHERSNKPDYVSYECSVEQCETAVDQALDELVEQQKIYQDVDEAGGTASGKKSKGKKPPQIRRPLGTWGVVDH